MVLRCKQYKGVDQVLNSAQIWPNFWIGLSFSSKRALKHVDLAITFLKHVYLLSPYPIPQFIVFANTILNNFADLLSVLPYV